MLLPLLLITGHELRLFFFRSGCWSFFETLGPCFEVCGRRVCNLTCFPLHGQILMNIQQSQPQSSFVLGPLPHSTYHTQGIFMEHHITGFKPHRFVLELDTYTFTPHICMIKEFQSTTFIPQTRYIHIKPHYRGHTMPQYRIHTTY